MRLAIAVLLAPVLLATLAPAAPVPTHLMRPSPYYYALAPGSKWVYEDPNGEETLVVAKVEEVDEAKVVTVDRVIGRTAVVWAKVAVAPRSLIQLESHGQKNDPPLVVLKGSLEVGTAWPVDTGGIKGTMRIGAIEKVTVPAGTFEAVRVDADVAFLGTKKRDRSWYAPAIGLVKMTYDKKERVLKSFTPGRG